MKKLLTIIMAMTMVLCFAACGSEEPTGVESTGEFADVNWDELYSEMGYSDELFDEPRAEMEGIIGENGDIDGDYDEALAMTFTNGTYVGKQDGDVLALKGVPYAVQPTGKNRWKPVDIAKSSDKVHEAYYFGHSSIQPEDFQEWASLYTQGEDCLSLNIWTNTKDTTEKKPIMVFIHGGAYIWGGSSDILYDGTDFVKDNGDAIFVSINYRLGIMGFANFENVEGGDKYPDTANLGIRDQIVALKWIKENAEAMGGDAENITIFGESAGAGSVAALMASPETDGLFQHVMAESGNCSAFFRSEATSQEYTDIIMGISGAENMDDLLALNADQLKDLSMKLYLYTNEYTYPEPDDDVIPMDCLDAISKNNIDVDFMTGTNKDEIKAWIVDYGGIKPFLKYMTWGYQADRENMNAEQKQAVKELKKEIDSSEKIDFINAYFNAVKFNLPARNEALVHDEAGGNSYMYYFTEEMDEPFGACHAADLRYTFNQPDEDAYSEEPADPYLMKVMQRAWVNFAKTGDPSIPEGEVPGAGAINWSKYNEDTHELMILNSAGCEMQTDPLWENYLTMKPFTNFE